MTTDFGRDTFCITSRKTGRYASGRMLLGQRLVHRFITPRGQLRGGQAEANFGLDLAGLVGAATDDDLESSIGPRIQNEALKDEQVESLTVGVEQTEAATEITWTFTLDVQSALGPFKLVLVVDDVTTKAMYEDA